MARTVDTKKCDAWVSMGSFSAGGVFYLVEVGVMENASVTLEEKLVSLT